MSPVRVRGCRAGARFGPRCYPSALLAFLPITTSVDLRLAELLRLLPEVGVYR
jgi:hypothetical protein